MNGLLLIFEDRDTPRGFGSCYAMHNLTHKISQSQVVIVATTKGKRVGHDERRDYDVNPRI